jgi:dipeptidyl-peptidase III
VQFGIDWVQDNPAVDFDNGFIEVYRDARGAKGSSQSFVTVTDEALASRMRKLSDNAQYFEDHAPWLAQYKMQGVKPPVAKAVEALIETGDFHVTTIGDNLPNENEVHEKYGSKSFMFTGSIHALDHATGFGPLEEFAASPEEIALGKKYGDEAGSLMTALHEVIGHGSGKLSPKLTHEPSYYLKEYFSTTGGGARRSDGAVERLRSQAAGAGAGLQPGRGQGHVQFGGAGRVDATAAHSEGRHHRRGPSARPPVDRALHHG